MLWLLFACTCADPTPEGPAGPAPHYAGAEALLPALRAGRPEAVAAAAAALEGDAAAPDASAPNPEAQAALDRLHGALGLLQIAEDLPEAADAAAVLAVSCGRCHQAQGLGPRFGVQLPAPSSEAAARHRQASEALWWAAVAGDAATWAAADALQREALGALAPGHPLPPTTEPGLSGWELGLAAWLEGCAGCHGG